MVLGVVLAVAVVTAVLASLAIFAIALPTKVPVVPQGTTWSIPPRNYEYVGPVSLTGHSSWRISGSFTADPGTDAFVLTSTDYVAWGGGGFPSSYAWFSGSNVNGSTYDVTIAGGSYYFVWLALNTTTATTVDITGSIDATASG